MADPLMPTAEAVLAGENLMVVVNTARYPDDYRVHKMYCFPNDKMGWRNGYRHYPARYIGNYYSKGVKHIGIVAACVHLQESGDASVLWRYDEITEAEAIARAKAVRETTRRNPRPCTVLIQSQLATTDFAYDLPGGLQGSRQFFDVSVLAPTYVKDLATKLRAEFWSSLPKRSG